MVAAGAHHGPLLANDSENSAVEKLSYPRRIAIFASWVVFAALLLYASGFTLIVAILLQQCGWLPSDQRFLFALFPGAMGAITSDDSGYVDLVNHDYLIICVPFFLASMLWEAFLIFAVLPADRRPPHRYRINDTISSLSTGILYLLVGKVVLLDWGRPLYRAIYTHCRLTDAFRDVASPVAWWLSFLADDFLYYVGHRSAHYFSWLWMSHAVHHSSEEYNLSTALRQPANDFLTPSVLIFTTSMAFVFPPELAVFQGQFGLLYQFWIHTQLVPPLPWVELFFNTPSLHRIHHARNIRALGKNYGSVLSIWDRMGGTFEPEMADPDALHYGVIPPLNSLNPLWANLSHLHYMLYTQRAWHGWATPFVHWTPPNGRCPRLGTRLNPFAKFDPRPFSKLTQSYVIAEFLLVLVATVVAAFAPVPRTMTSMQRSLMFGCIFLIILAALVSVSIFQSAATRKALRKAVVLDVCRHVVVVLVAASAIYFTNLSFNLTLYTGLAVYGMFHLCFLTPLFNLSSSYASEDRVCGSGVAG
eukprot:TRINITY_DN29775_c0_g1_i2.p1 TRINITY_DN29775_c0_g1~~TRINITY_DN29775_c0_g1_i2.p1  ORF type:complete len:543 (-),score=56.34 TRINITY_DN29775_c0_g1_i2:169-1761(-)